MKQRLIKALTCALPHSFNHPPSAEMTVNAEDKIMHREEY